MKTKSIKDIRGVLGTQNYIDTYPMYNLPSSTFRGGFLFDHLDEEDIVSQQKNLLDYMLYHQARKCISCVRYVTAIGEDGRPSEFYTYDKGKRLFRPLARLLVPRLILIFDLFLSKQGSLLDHFFPIQNYLFEEYDRIIRKEKLYNSGSLAVYFYNPGYYIEDNFKWGYRLPVYLNERRGVSNSKSHFNDYLGIEEYTSCQEERDNIPALRGFISWISGWAASLDASKYSLSFPFVYYWDWIFLSEELEIPELKFFLYSTLPSTVSLSEYNIFTNREAAQECLSELKKYSQFLEV